MRFEPSERLLKLVVMLQARRFGVGLQDIRQEFSVSRRTAERMRDAVGRIFPDLEEVPTDLPTKRWRLANRLNATFLEPTVDEIASLDSAKKLFDANNRSKDAQTVSDLKEKLIAKADASARVRLGPDIEALMEAEGLAARPGPRPTISESVLQDLRDGIKQCTKIRLHYKSRETGKLSKQLVCPYGLLYGSRHYLVAFSLNPSILDYRLYSLSTIKRTELTDQYFERREDFSLEEYAANSFGVFQEEPFDVVWKFSPRVAADAKEFLFHPSQLLEEHEDGSLLVKFRAGGWLEMCWHLFMWGEQVEILEPKWLSERMQALLRDASV